MRPHVVIHLVFYRTLLSQSGISITMSSLAAYLRKAGARVTLNFFERQGIHNLDQLELSTNHNVIIAKPNFKDFRDLLSQLNELKRSGRVKRVWLCGTFASLNASGILADHLWLDGVIVGQPEESAAELIKCLSGENLSWDLNCPGGIWRDPTTGALTELTSRTSTVSLDALPFPARDLEVQEWGNYCNIEATRGCMYKCTFCHITATTVMDRKSGFDNVRSPERVVDEIEDVNRTIGKTLFIFNDPVFWASPADDERILKFCAEIERRKLDVRFYIYLRCQPLIGEKVLAALAKAGLVRVFLGVETVNERSQTAFLKRMPKGSYERIKELFDRYDINIHIGYIAIEPFATLDEVWQNIAYLRRIDKLFRIGVVTESVRVVPGTSFHQQLLVSGLLEQNLPYDQLTYGYRFANPEVGELLGGFQQMFRQTLTEPAYIFEYHATTAGLMRILAIRLDEKFRDILHPDFTVFCKIRDETMDLLLGYFERSICSARNGAKTLDIGAEQGNEKFVEGFRQKQLEMQVAYNQLQQTIISRGGERAVREVYTGEDRL